MTPGRRPSIDDACRCPLLRHALDLHWVGHLPDGEREAVLDHMAMYDLRAVERARVERRRELALLRRLDTAAVLLDELEAFLDEREHATVRLAA